MSDRLYESDSVIVEKTRYVVDGTTYPVSSIVAVAATSEEFGSWVTLIIAVFIGFVGFKELSLAGIVVGIIAFGYAYYKRPRKEYYVEISTAAGRRETFASTDKTEVFDIVEAINNAIVARG